MEFRFYRMTQRQRPRFIERVALRLSTSRQVDGLWVGVALLSEPEPILRRVEEALLLIKLHDQLRYGRLVRDLERIWVRDLPGALGTFSRALQACSLDIEYVRAETTRPESIAAVIVHEATHARLELCGIGYEEELRPRVEAICFRRELAFAARLPNGEQVRQEAEHRLAAYATSDYWTDAAFAERFDNHIEALRRIGAPDWLGRTMLTLRGPYRRVQRFFKFTRRLFLNR
jgi:hypothetical protein